MFQVPFSNEKNTNLDKNIIKKNENRIKHKSIINIIKIDKINSEHRYLVVVVLYLNASAFRRDHSRSDRDVEFPS